MISKLILFIFTFAFTTLGFSQPILGSTNLQNNCITFSVAEGTGCNWMCNYCSNQLSTNNYYFTDNVCMYQTGGCVGNPIASKQYTCCAVSYFKDEL